MAEDKDNKTEKATPKRKEEARKKGQVAMSRDVVTAAILLAGVGLLGGLMPLGLERLTDMVRHGLSLSAAQVARDGMTVEQVATILFRSAVTVLTLTLPIVGSILLIGSAASLAQTGLLWKQEGLQLELSRINPLKGLSRLFSLRSVMEMVKGLLKIAVITGVGLFVVRHDVLQVPGLMDFDLASIVGVTGWLALKVALAVCGVIVVLGGLDYFYQRYEWERDLRMSKEEIKEEHKSAEGDPLIKSRVRTAQRDMSRKRMMAAVKTADVVVTNPTHLAVALKYDSAKRAAPFVVAKGAGLVAERIRELARHHGVPVVEHKFVARTIFKLVEVGKEIPADLYRAVAEILAFVYRARGQGVGAGAGQAEG
jgi:flagellar biosynthetic protein FlhB